MTDQTRKVHENMGRLNKGEEYIRNPSITAIEADEALLNHVEMIEAVISPATLRWQ